MVKTIYDLPEATPSDLAALPAEMMLALQQQADANTKHASLIANILHSTLVARYAANLNSTGTHNLDDGTVSVSVTIPKKVKWDQALLAAAVHEVESWGENPADYVDTEIKVAERKFDAWPPSIRDVFAPARTLDTGKPVFKLTPREAG
jgi:hypothetical protein